MQGQLLVVAGAEAGRACSSEEKSESQRQKTLERELEWIRMSPKGRHAKGKARINSYENLLNQQTQEKVQELEIYIPPGPRLGNIVIEADDVRKAFGDNAAHRRHGRSSFRRAASSA